MRFNNSSIFLHDKAEEKRERHSIFLQDKMVPSLLLSMKRANAHPFTEIELAACLMKRLMLDMQERYYDERLSDIFSDFLDSLNEDIISALPTAAFEGLCHSKNKGNAI